MSRYTYVGDFVNPVSSWRIASRETDAGETEHFIECHHEETRTIDGVEGTFSFWTPHTSGHKFDDVEDAEAYIEGIEESFEEDYDDYLEENRHAIVQMERHEMWKREY